MYKEAEYQKSADALETLGRKPHTHILIPHQHFRKSADKSMPSAFFKKKVLKNQFFGHI
jgi:hypothetical protein